VTFARRVALTTLVVLTCVSRSATSEETLLDHFSTMLRLSDEAQADPECPMEVYRMELDVTGDGEAELFLGTSRGGSRQGAPWVVHQRETDDRFRPLGFLEFAYDSFFFVPEESRLATAKSAGPRLPAYYASYHVGEDGIWETTEGGFGTLAENKARAAAWRSEGRPPMYHARLSELRTSAEPSWKNWETGEPEPSVGPLDGVVSESGDCSAEEYLNEFRGAGCVSIP
jgi:hypothetical protein